MSRHASSSLSSAAIGGIVAGALASLLLLLAFFMLKRRRASKERGGRRLDAEFTVGIPALSYARDAGEGHVTLSTRDPAVPYVHAAQAHAFSKLAQELAQAQAHLGHADTALLSDTDNPRVTFDLLQNRLREIAGLIAEQEARAGILPDREARSEAAVLSDGGMHEALPAYDARGFVSTDLPPK
jgi:hypothetical protein